MLCFILNVQQTSQLLFMSLLAPTMIIKDVQRLSDAMQKCTDNFLPCKLEGQKTFNHIRGDSKSLPSSHGFPVATEKQGGNAVFIFCINAFQNLSSFQSVKFSEKKKNPRLTVLLYDLNSLPSFRKRLTVADCLLTLLNKIK